MCFTILVQNITNAPHSLIYLPFIQIKKGYPYGSWFVHSNSKAANITHFVGRHCLQLYNKLLQTAYSPIAALNRTYALAKANGKEQAIAEAEKLQLNGNHLYHSLLGNLYTGRDNKKALQHYQTAIGLAKSTTVKAALTQTISRFV